MAKQPKQLNQEEIIKQIIGCRLETQLTIAKKIAEIIAQQEEEAKETINLIHNGGNK